MIKDIPQTYIPNIAYNDGIKIIPKAIINHYNDFFRKIKIDLEIDKKIEIQNHRNIYHFKYYYEMINIIQENFYNSINQDAFWKKIMNYKVCHHKFKKGNKAGDLCGRLININVKDKYGKFLCSDHISKKYYDVKLLNVPEEERCIGNTINNERCKFRKKYRQFCKFHYAEKYNINKNDVELHYKRKFVYKTKVKDITLNYITLNDANAVLLEINNKIKINNIRIIDPYGHNESNNIKLICYYNYKTKNSILDEDILNKLDIKKNIEKDKEICINKESFKFLNKTNTELINLNANINNFKYKLEIIKEILNINPSCSSKGCTYINNIKIIKGLYCESHAIDALNKYKNNRYKINNWNYL